MVTEGAIQTFRKEAALTLRAANGKLWGFEPSGQASIIFIGDELPDQERKELLAYCPSFKQVWFLAGHSREARQEAPSLVQRIREYNGTLPGWKWALRDGDWKDTPNEEGEMMDSSVQLFISEDGSLRRIL